MLSRCLIVLLVFFLLYLPLICAAKKSMLVKMSRTQLFVEWQVDWTNQEVQIDVKYRGNRPKWILVGFSDHGQIGGSDGCVYDGRQFVLDVHLLSNGRIEKDRHQDCRLIRSNPKNMHFRFKRKFLTCDPRDYAIEFGTTNFIFAVGRTRQYSIRSEHSEHIIRENSLLDPVVKAPPLPPNNHLFKMDITAQNVEIPAQVTSYWCQVMPVDDRILYRKHHAIEYAAIITPGNEHLVHHMEIFHCRENPGESYGGLCDNPEKPEKAKSCSKVLAAWAMGAEPVVYPLDAGMPIGGKGFVPYVMVEIHYNNVHKEAGVIDNSGFRIIYTDQLREYDAAVIELGLIYSDANSIPPGQASFPITGHCVADCTQKFPQSGIKIFATQLHAHLTGRKLFTSHYRNGVKIGEINRDNHYSPHWQVVRSLPKHIHVLPNDVLSTTCVFDTSNRKNWTWGGYEIENEMCVNYVYYYPASNNTLNTFFNKYIGKQHKSLKIHEKYLKLKQTQKMYDIVREWYATEPLNMGCLDHSGELFKGQSWSSIPRPELFAGAYDKTPSNLECPSIND